MLGIFLLGLATPAAAQVDPTQPIRYALGQGSTYEHGCFGPCACPVLESGTLAGSFVLTYQMSDPLFNWYGVSDVDWTATLTYGGTDHQIKGAGTYRVGGEVAVVQELALDLALDADPLQSFTSGLVAGGGEFPAIDITIKIPDAGCSNTVMHVVAKPTTHVSVSESAVAWQALLQTAGYDVVVGNLSVLRQTHGDFKQATQSCVADEAAGDQLDYGAEPGPGQGLWILVRPDGGSWDGGDSMQVGSRDAEIDAAPAGCP